MPYHINTREDVVELLISAITAKVNQIRTHTVTGNQSSERQLVDIMLDTLHENGICLREAPPIIPRTVTEK